MDSRVEGHGDVFDLLTTFFFVLLLSLRLLLLSLYLLTTPFSRVIDASCWFGMLFTYAWFESE